MSRGDRKNTLNCCLRLHQYRLGGPSSFCLFPLPGSRMLNFGIRAKGGLPGQSNDSDVVVEKLFTDGDMENRGNLGVAENRGHSREAVDWSMHEVMCEVHREIHISIYRDL